MCYINVNDISVILDCVQYFCSAKGLLKKSMYLTPGKLFVSTQI